MPPEECLFCKIAAGDLPAQVVYESEHCIAFLDIAPLSDGHTLVIAREHFSRIEEMPAAAAAHLFEVVPMLARAVCEATNAPALNVLQNNGPQSGQSVPHVHVHLIPRAEGDHLGYRWNAGDYSPGRATELHKRIADAVDARA